MLYAPSSHAPKSISLQRSEQNGRKGLASEKTVGFLQAGQFIEIAGHINSYSCLQTPQELAEGEGFEPSIPFNTV
jgi:hypothetical protein